MNMDSEYSWYTSKWEKSHLVFQNR